ncbi:MAG: lipoyl(octanoyl) transferase LipB [Gemmatimonadaceae bacterium]|nr:lipoyl(octanoyl) transferase LipB [Chitinophagaceae bacterium]
MMQQLQFTDLGVLDYKSAWDIQEQLLQKNLQAKSFARAQEDAGVVGVSADTIHNLLFVEHPPVYTLGKSGKAENLLISQEECIARGIEYYPINRGGDITFHGLEQLVGYPILDLEKMYTDIGRYLRNIEQVIILSLADFGIASGRSAGETGVWIDAGVVGSERKICAIGVRCSRWITMHGFALNVNTDLSYFDNIIPCGIRDKQVTSMKRELGRDVPMDEIKTSVLRNFEKVLDLECI